MKEQRIKRFLDDCAYMMLRDNSEDTLSYYKEKANLKREIPISSCPSQFEHYLYSGRQVKNAQAEKILFEDMMNRMKGHGPALSDLYGPKKRKPAAEETRSQRIDRIREAHPGCSFHFCRVDTENVFTFEDTMYEIDEAVAAYSPTQTRHGLLYDTDEIMIVRDTDGGLHYYTPQAHPVPAELVYRMT